MRRAAVLLSALSIAAVGSCARAPEAVPAGEAAVPGVTTTVWNAGAEDGLSWFFNPASDGLKLAYGAPNSDAVRLMIYCQGGGNLRLETSTPASPPARTLRLVSGAEETALPMSDEANPMGGRLLSAAAAVDAPALAAFRRSGRLSMSAGAAAVPMHAGAGESADVERFFAACR